MADDDKKNDDKNTRTLTPRERGNANLKPFTKNDPRRDISNAGRRKGGKNLSKSIDEVFALSAVEYFKRIKKPVPPDVVACKSMYDAVAYRLIKTAMDSDGVHNKQLLPILKTIMDRQEGMATRKIEVKGGVDVNVGHYRKELSKNNADMIKKLLDAEEKADLLEENIIDAEVVYSDSD